MLKSGFISTLYIFFFIFIYHIGLLYAILHTLIHTVCIKVCDIPHKTEFRRYIASKICPSKLEIYLSYALSLDLCGYNIVWTATYFNSVFMSNEV